MKPGVTWEGYFPIGIGALPPSAAVFLVIKRTVLPLVRRWRREGLTWVTFLVHDYQDDPRPHIHIRASFEDERTISYPVGWVGVRRAEFGAPFPPDGITGGNDRARELWGRQTEWILDLVESIDANIPVASAGDIIGQFLHYFANMTQMRIG